MASINRDFYNSYVLYDVMDTYKVGPPSYKMVYKPH